MAQPLLRYQSEIVSIFDLLGRTEVDLTAALGWTLSVSPALRRALWERLGLPGKAVEVGVALETADASGRTDLELRLGGDVLVIVEAKKGWLQPGETQLGKYVGRFTGIRTPLLVSLSDSSLAWASRELPAYLGGVPVRHLPWDEIRDDLRTVMAKTRSVNERVWLRELQTYLKGATAVRAYDEQWVYVVSLSRNVLGSHSFLDYVQDERVYFHPFGKNWPPRPPVLMGFRWDGRLRQVNRVTTATVLPRLQDRWPDIPEGPGDGASYGPHAVYDLGPDLAIPNIPSGKMYPSLRVWTLLDQLLTQPTILAASKASKALQDAAR